MTFSAALLSSSPKQETLGDPTTKDRNTGIIQYQFTTNDLLPCYLLPDMLN